jgi:hypothetical protein
MRDKLANIAAVFVPLGFIGGLTSGGIVAGILSAAFWGVVFLMIRPKY